MPKLPSTFNSEDHDELSDFSAVPAGDYHVKIKDTQWKENKKQTGSYISFHFQILEGDYKGRLLFANLNLDHVNPSTVEMAQKSLAAICRAVGRVSIDDTDELHNDELMVKVTKRPASSQYAESNDIKNYFPVEGLAKPKKPSFENNEDGTPVKQKSRKVSFD